MVLSRRKLLRRAAGGAATALVLGTGGAILLRGFDDDASEDSSTTLPPGLRRAALDVHVHVLGAGTWGSGCWMSASMHGSIPVKAGLWNLRLRHDQPDLDQAYIAYLRSRIQSAGFLRQVVLLAMDTIWTAGGERDLAHSQYYTPNEYVAGLARQYPEFLFGASVHPYRADALEELDRVAEAGAVLVKWIPNVHRIDLGDPRCRAFYRRMAGHKMVLLTHSGDEQAIPGVEQRYGDPRGLRAPLEEGVTVIAAHVASLGEREGRSNFDLLAEMFPRWPNLYADTSALTLFTRWRTLLRLAERTDLHSRLVHGSDFPLPPACTLFLGRMPLSQWWDAWKRENGLRRDFEIKQALGLPEDIYRRGYEVLAPRLKMLRAKGAG